MRLPMLLLKLLLTPLLTLAVSLAARAWGHRASGWLTSLPLVAGPIAAVLLIEQGAAFVMQMSVSTLASLPAIAAYILVFARLARHRGWAASLVAGWAVFILCAIPLSFLPIGPWAGLATTWAALAAAYRLLPRSSAPRVPVHVPRIEIAFRMAASVALMLLISYGADTFGPQVSGALMAFPIGGSVLPAFTRALHGVEATTMLMRGFTLGMFAFPLFVFVLAVAVLHVHPVAAFAGGIVAVLAGHFVAALASNRGWVR
jgi:hypothetical protein